MGQIRDFVYEEAFKEFEMELKKCFDWVDEGIFIDRKKLLLLGNDLFDALNKDNIIVTDEMKEEYKRVISEAPMTKADANSFEDFIEPTYDNYSTWYENGFKYFFVGLCFGIGKGIGDVYAQKYLGPNATISTFLCNFFKRKSQNDEENVPLTCIETAV